MSERPPKDCREREHKQDAHSQPRFEMKKGQQRANTGPGRTSNASCRCEAAGSQRSTCRARTQGQQHTGRKKVSYGEQQQAINSAQSRQYSTSRIKKSKTRQHKGKELPNKPAASPPTKQQAPFRDSLFGFERYANNKLLKQQAPRARKTAYTTSLGVETKQRQRKTGSRGGVQLGKRPTSQPLASHDQTDGPSATAESTSPTSFGTYRNGRTTSATHNRYARTQRREQKRQKKKKA